MEIEINGNNIKLHFGLDFIENLDVRISKILNQSIDDTPYGQGLATYVQLFLGDDYRALTNVLYEGTCTMEKDRPTVKDIKNYIENVDSIDDLKAEVLEELKKSDVCRRRAEMGETEYLKTLPPEESPRKRSTKKS